MSVTDINAFRPILGNTVSISATDSSSSAAITMGDADNLLVTNSGSSLCYVGYDTSAPTVDGADYPVLPNSQVVINVPDDITHVGAICDSANTTIVKFTPGRGV